jgi:hypothetical protein
MDVCVSGGWTPQIRPSDGVEIASDFAIIETKQQGIQTGIRAYDT